MNFIQLVQAVRLRVGMQGTGPASVSTTGYEAALVAAVSDSWIDIQNFREDWKWMRASASFLTVADTTTYSRTTILGPSYRHKKWLLDTAYVIINGKHKRLRYIPYDEFTHRYQDESKSSSPTDFTVRESDNSIIINNPDAAYTVKIDYQKSPQVLTSDTDTPELPIGYHLLIVYLAVERYASYIYNIEAQAQYSLQYTIMLGQLLRDQLPSKRVKHTGGIA